MTDATAALMGDNGGADGGAAGNTGAVDNGAWNSGFDEETNAYVGNKGWQGVDDVLSSYRNLEKFVGGSKNLIEMPGEDAGADALGAFFNKLGRPETADAYNLNVPDTADADLTDWFRNTAHELGLSDRQAASLYDKWNEMSDGRMEQMQSNQELESEQAIANLKKEWGQGFDAQIDMGKRAVNALGYDQESLSSLEEKLGTADMLKLFAAVGSKMGEDTFEGSDRKGSGSFGLTPAAAQQQMNDLRTDKAFMDQYLAGNKDAVAKMTRLMEAAFA